VHNAVTSINNSLMQSEIWCYKFRIGCKLSQWGSGLRPGSQSIFKVLHSLKSFKNG